MGFFLLLFFLLDVKNQIKDKNEKEIGMECDQVPFIFFHLYNLMHIVVVYVLSKIKGVKLFKLKMKWIMYMLYFWLENFIYIVHAYLTKLRWK